MKFWIAYLLNHPAAVSDFIEDMEDRGAKLLKAQNSAILNGESGKAVFIAHEANVYETLLKAVRKEYSELSAQLERDERS